MTALDGTFVWGRLSHMPYKNPTDRNARRAARMAADPVAHEVYKASKRLYYQNNKEKWAHAKTPEALAWRRERRKNAAVRAAETASRARWAGKNPVLEMLSEARSRARLKGIVFSITKSDVSIPSVCPLLGIPIVRGQRHVASGSPSLDRIDPSKGYEPGNVWVISHRANRAKGDLSLEELKRLVANLEAKCLPLS